MARMLFHGTSAENAAKILKHGFKPGTYFARGLETAIGFGGDHVFWVLFEVNPFERACDDSWQVVISNRIPASQIVYLKIYSSQTSYYSAKASHRLRTLVLQEEHGPKAELCSTCDGNGELGSTDPLGNWTPQGDCIVCPTCDGEGSLAAMKAREAMIKTRDAVLKKRKTTKRAKAPKPKNGAP